MCTINKVVKFGIEPLLLVYMAFLSNISHAYILLGARHDDRQVIDYCCPMITIEYSCCAHLNYMNLGQKVFTIFHIFIP